MMKPAFFVLVVLAAAAAAGAEDLDSVTIKFDNKMPAFPLSFMKFYVSAYHGGETCSASVTALQLATEITPAFKDCTIQKSPEVVIEIYNPAIFGKKSLRLGEVASSGAGEIISR